MEDGTKGEMEDGTMGEMEGEMEADMEADMEALHKELIDELTQAATAHSSESDSTSVAVHCTGTRTHSCRHGPMHAQREVAGDGGEITHSCGHGPIPTDGSTQPAASGDGMRAAQGDVATDEEGTRAVCENPSVRSQPAPTDALGDNEESMRYALHTLYGVVLSPSGSAATGTLDIEHNALNPARDKADEQGRS